MVQAVFENFEKKGNKTSTKFRNRKKNIARLKGLILGIHFLCDDTRSPHAPYSEFQFLLPKLPKSGSSALRRLVVQRHTIGFQYINVEWFAVKISFVTRRLEKRWLPLRNLILLGKPILSAFPKVTSSCFQVLRKVVSSRSSSISFNWTSTWILCSFSALSLAEKLFKKRHSPS